MQIKDTTMSDFVIDPHLSSGEDVICELPLSRFILGRNGLYPWVLLVPRQNNLREIIDLSEEDSVQLMHEIRMVSHIMQDVFKPVKINVAQLGNLTPQLHVHIIARYTNDPAWPGAVFGKEGNLERSSQERLELLTTIRQAVNNNGFTL